MDAREAWAAIGRHFGAKPVEPTHVRGFFKVDGETVRFAEFGPDGEMPRRADGRYDSPYRVWLALTEPPTRISRDSMGFGCPTCGAPFDRMEQDTVETERVGLAPRINRSPTYAICRNEHRFILDPNVVRA